MSLQFVIGASGTGKSITVYREILQRANVEPKRRFFIIVPDQFTMQTQKVLCQLADNGGIMNVEVLSFSRLAHRIFEELGFESLPKLDDTGKNLILRKVAADHEEDLSILSTNIKRVGFIAEIKSMISEFAQYGIYPEDLEKYCEVVSGKGNLRAKLADLQILYREYKKYISDKFITTEETIDILVKYISRSALIKDSVVVFDGFTGFTPIQDRLLQELMILCKQVIVTLIADNKTDLISPEAYQSMFCLTAKAYQKLCRLAEDSMVSRDEDIVLDSMHEYRFADNKGLAHLEHNLFRARQEQPAPAAESVKITRCMNPKDEVDEVCLSILELIRTKGYCYRDFAVVSGDLNNYGHLLKEGFAEHDIPMFLDQNTSLLFHPFMVFLQGIFKVLVSDFSYEAVMELLRVGYFDLEEEQIDLFEKYILARGIRGKKKYAEAFKGVDAEKYDVNSVRLALLGCLQPLLAISKKEDRNAVIYTERLYDICVNMRIEEKLAQKALEYQEKGMAAKAKEYEQVFGAVIGLFDQIHALLQEEMDFDLYSEILKAGFAELKVGTIPQSVDQVIAGDLERTRLKPIKVLFVVGANDGIIPGKGSSGGLLSDLERTFLAELGVELAPTPRQKGFEERLYLYMNMTQPTEQLRISFAEVDTAGAALRPSYLIRVVQNLYTDLVVQILDEKAKLQRVESRESGLKLLTRLLREYVSGVILEDSEEWKLLLQLSKIYCEDEAFVSSVAAAFFGYSSVPLPKELAEALFGKILHTSVSRLEQFSACAYSHFLKYGLQLSEDEEFSFDITDLGTMYHDVLYRLGMYIEANNQNWLTLSMDVAGEFIDQAVDEFAENYRNKVLYDSERSMALKDRTKQILKTTVQSLAYQLRRGVFEPICYELPFNYHDNPELHGVIDRLDIATDADNVYVKVLDYKSGQHAFEPARLYYGLDLQLAVYLIAAVVRQQKANPNKNIIPSAIFYYQINDPMLEGAISESPEARAEKIQKELLVQGLIMEDDVVLEKLDTSKEQESTVIPIKYKKDGQLTSASQTATKKQFELIGKYVDYKVQKIGEDIRKGTVDISPIDEQGKSACRYCAYKGICSFEKRLPGFIERKVELKGEAVYDAIEKELTESGIYDGSKKGH